MSSLRRAASLLAPLPLLAGSAGLASQRVPLPALAQSPAPREAFPIPDATAPPAGQDPALPAMPVDRPAPGPRPRSLDASGPPVQPAPTAVAYPADPATRTFRYRLGPGDRLRMSVFMVEGYEADAEVLGDGTVNLPRLGSVPVWGLTMDEARQRITQGYERYLRRPLVYLDLVAPRPVRVTLVGEVQKPGFYTLTQTGQSGRLAAGGPGSGETTIASAGWPTLVDAVQKAGGVTALADLTDVVLTRPSPTPGGRPVDYRFNYLEVLMERRTTVNPLLYDGDTIRIATAPGPLSPEVQVRTAASNFAPDTIGVTVVGEVVVPGLKQVRSNSPLAAAVIAAGDVNPLRANPKEIRLIRVKPDGVIDVRTVSLDPSAPLDSPANPSLHNGDMVVVPRNGWTRFNDFLVQAVTPLGPVLNAASIYRIFAD